MTCWRNGNDCVNADGVLRAANLGICAGCYYDLRAKLAAVTAERDEARGWSRRWKAWAKGMFRGWRRVVPDPEQQDLLLLGMGPSADEKGFDVHISGNNVTRMMAQAFFNLLDEHDAENYVEQTLMDGEGRRVIVRVQRVGPEAKTPHQLRRDAEVERDAALADLKSLREQLLSIGVQLGIGEKR